MIGNFVYIMTNKNNNVLYIGVTSKLYQRIIKHKEKHHPFSFTAKYNCNKLVYFEEFQNIEEAIEREKQLKGCPIQKKLKIIEGFNPEWNDLFDDLK